MPRKRRTWWHPLLARLLAYELGTAYKVDEEVAVGTVPMRLDVVLLRRGRGKLSEMAKRSMGTLARVLNRITLIEFKGPTDRLEHGDFDYLFGCAHFYRGQQRQRIPQSDLTCVFLAPRVSKAFRQDLEVAGLTLVQVDTGLFEIRGAMCQAFVVESDAKVGLSEPILTLFSPTFLQHQKPLVREYAHSDYQTLMSYVVQQVLELSKLGEPFSLTHEGTNAMKKLAENWKQEFLKLYSIEERLAGLGPAERLAGLGPAERLAGLGPAERLAGLSAEEREQLARMLVAGNQ